MADVRATQVGVETALPSAATDVRASQIGVEVVLQPTVATRTSQLIVEYIRGASIPARSAAVEYIRRLRQAPHLADEDRRVVYTLFELDLQGGIGLATGQGSDPTVRLSWSDDDGATWSNEVPRSAGATADYLVRVIWRRLGQSRGRIFRVVMSDPVDWVLLDAYIDLVKGTS